MRKILICFVFVSAFVITTFGQSLTPMPAPMQVSLVGTINSSLKIRMKLTRQGNELKGSYFYESKKKNIPLRGIVSEQGYFELDEYGAKDAITGHIIGAFTRDQEVVGFWSKDDGNASPKLAMRLVEEGKGTASNNHKFEVINAYVKRDRGTAQLLLIDGTILGFSYENVGGNFHTCTMIVDRSEQPLVWKDNGQETSIFFTKAYFNAEQNTAKVVIQQSGSGYTITFDGFLNYFCGAHAMLPPKLTIHKGSKGWVGQ